MKKIATLIVFILAFFASQAQNFSSGKTSVTYVDASRSNRQIPADVYYPADVAGTDVPLATGIDKFPVVVFGHGFVITPSAYEWLGDSLSQKGYIVVIPSTEGSILPSHSDFAADLAFLCNYVISLNDSTTSFLYQRLIKKSAVAGHSMGGGCSFLAAAADTSIKAIFNFSAAETSPSAITAALSVHMPALVFSGSSDCIVPANTQQSMYTNIAAACKTYIDVTGALHCQYANNNGTCVLGQVLSGCNSSSITPDILFNKVTTLLIPFLDYYLKDNCSAGDAYIASYLNITGVTKLQSCTSSPSCGALAVSMNNFSGTINNNVVTLHWDANAAIGIKNFIVERSMDGNSFTPLENISVKNDAGQSVSYTVNDKYPYPGNSFYRLKIIDAANSYSYSEIIKITSKTKALALTRLFPNPASTNVNIELASDKNQQVHISVTSYNGATIFNNYLPVNAGLNEKNIVTWKWAAGYYILQIFDEKNTIVTTTGIIKL